jgi:alkyl sulfatase BDS1-like metallo-beta-lactamase superfamily hydrolase
MPACAKAAEAHIEGRREALRELLALREPFDYWFNIVTP